jgi:hypothetical protein
MSVGERWFHIRQNKHHRWSLDEGQILQYHLGGRFTRTFAGGKLPTPLAEHSTFLN